MLRMNHSAVRIATKSLLALAILAVAAPGLAQESRGDRLAALQAEKATRLHPYEPNPLEQRIEKAETALSTFTKDGLYPFAGSTFEGSGLGFGPGYRGRYRDTGTFDAHAAWTFRNYKAAGANIKLPAFADGRVSVEMRANWLDAPSVAFYGTGNDSLPSNRATFSFGTTSVGVAARVQAARFVGIGGGIDSVRTEATSVGGGASAADLSPTYRRMHLFAEYDWRTSPGYTKRGGLYRVEWADFQQTNVGAYNFRRTDAEVQQFIPIFRENWIIALRALASSTSTAPGQDVPYFLLPHLGGGQTLRGYPSWRFRDRDRLLLTGEYRWSAGPFVDMALFLDAGQVAARAEDFAWRAFKKTYGVGVSLHTLTSTVTRIEVARTPEGTSLVFSWGPSF